MDRDQFLRERMRGVGGSDAPAILGLSHRKTALEVYLEKRGELAPEPDNASMRAGRLLEPAVRQMYAEDTGRIVTQPTTQLVHPKYSFVIGNPDGLAEGRLYEGKIARMDFGWGVPGSDQIPQDYLVQVQHYLAITGLPVADVAVLIGGCDFRIYEIPADAELQEMIVEAAAEFWARVQKGEAPEPDWGAPHALRAVQALFRGTNGQTVTATGEDEDMRKALDLASEKAKAYEAVAEGIKAHLLWQMGDNAQLRFADGKVLRRKLTKRKGYEVAPCEYIDSRITKEKE